MELRRTCFKSNRICRLCVLCVLCARTLLFCTVPVLPLTEGQTSPGAHSGVLGQWFSTRLLSENVPGSPGDIQ